MTALRFALSVPGRLSERLGRAGLPERLAADPIAVDALEALARRSPRGNAYLSLEPGLRAFATPDGALTWAGTRHTVFVVGGVHAHAGGAGRLLDDFRQGLRAARYRRGLIFPVATAERRLVRAAGFRTLAVGAEAFVDTADFTLSGRARADLRQMVNRGRKRYGVTAVELPAPAAGDDLGGVYARWLASRPVADPMALLVGTPCFDRPARRRFFAAIAPDRPEPVAFVTLTPAWGGAGYGVDVMARDPAAPAGAMDVLLTEVITRLADEGVATVSLGACPMAERTPLPWRDSRVLRAAFRWLYRSRLGNRLFPFASLARYKDKFAPRWEAVHLGAWPRLNALTLYHGCRLWGLFGRSPLVTGAPRAVTAALAAAA